MEANVITHTHTHMNKGSVSSFYLFKSSNESIMFLILSFTLL